MELTDVLRRRRMVRNFTDDDVTEAAIDRILAAGRRAPSAGNTDGTELLLLQGDAVARYWDTTLPAPRRERFRWPGLLRAPVLVVPCTRATAYVERYAEADKARPGLGDSIDEWPVPYWHIDTGMAVMAMLLAVVDEGLGALFFGIFEHEDAVRAAFAIPETHQPIGTIAIGHPAPDEPGRSAGRPRRDPAAVIHRGRW